MVNIEIIYTKKFKKDYQKLLIKKDLSREIVRLENIKNLIYNSKNMKDLIENPISKLYYIEKKSGNLKEYYTARLNNKIRLMMLPCSNYPYNLIEIVSIEFVSIDNNHYKG